MWRSIRARVVAGRPLKGAATAANLCARAFMAEMFGPCGCAPYRHRSKDRAAELDIVSKLAPAAPAG
jgi:hypothetical protein